MTADEKAIVSAYAAAHPPPQGDGSEGWLDRAYRNLPDGWMAKCAQQLRFSLGERYGHKRRNGSAPLSAGSFAVHEGDIMQVFDILIGVGTGAPRVDVGVESMAVHLTGPEAQEFVPVTPVNHLVSAKPTAGRAKLTGTVWGVDGFDLAPRSVGLGDWRYLDQVLVPNRLASRQFMNAAPISAPRLERSPALGLQQMTALLPQMRARGAQGSLFTVLNGTRNLGMSWQDALAYCRVCNALYMQFPELVVSVDLFNENSQGFEQDYATNPQFLREAEACFDLRFPVSPGAGHGGEGVMTICGSHASHHSDRDLLPDAAGAVMAEAVKRGWPVIDREGMGITELGRTAGRQRVSDPQWAAGQIAAVKKYGLAGFILHIDMGITCNVDERGPVQDACIALVATEAKGTPTIPPPQGHPILDFDMSDHAGFYRLFISKRREIEALAVAWYTKSRGHAPAESDISHGFYWRSMREWSWFGTLRRAFEDTWPGGAP